MTDPGIVRDVARVGLGTFLVAAGVAHLAVPEEFLGQVPEWLPARRPIVLVSGVVEITLGTALAVWRRKRVPLGWAVAGLLVGVFPGNIHQTVAGTDAFGLTTDTARIVRLVFQPALVAWALWSTGAWATWRSQQGQLIDGR
ncbi:MAG: hypothetical protein WD041_03315 [Nitriliruptoraceae bacterium]